MKAISKFSPSGTILDLFKLVIGFICILTSRITNKN